MRNIKTQTYLVTLSSKILLFQRHILILITVLSLLPNTKAQDLRDLTHTIKFANYLFTTQQFALSSEEFERVVFLDSTNNKAILKLLVSYRLSDKSDIAEQRFKALFEDDIYSANNDISKEYISNLISNKKYNLSYNYIEHHPKLDKLYKESYQLASLLLQNKRDEAYKYARGHTVTNDKKNAALHLLALNYKMIKYKKPCLAAGFSAIIPGSGKLYAKNWKDGLISFVLVGVNSWQAYRGFKKHGTKSAYGWVFAGLATSFYISNIFGSYKTAKKYNKKLDNEIHDKALHIVLSDN